MLGERKRPGHVSARNTETDLSADPDSALLAAAAAGDEKARRAYETLRQMKRE